MKGEVSLPLTISGAVWHQHGQGRIAVLGSVSMFDDKWIDKEENSKVMDFIFKWLRPVRGDGSSAAPMRSRNDCDGIASSSLFMQGSQLSLNDLDAEEPDVSDLKLLPDTQSLAEKLKGCLQASCYCYCFYFLLFFPVTLHCLLLYCLLLVFL
jgi:intraflagellar transport protein 52